MKTAMVTAPTTECLTLDEAKAQVRVDHDSEDALILDLLTAAREHVEALTNRKLLTQTHDVWFGGFDGDDEIEIPFGTLQQVTEFAYTGSDGTVTTWTESGGNLSYASTVRAHVRAGDLNERGCIELAYSQLWPITTLKTLDPIRVRFVCGYGDTRDKVPRTLRQAMLLWLEDQYIGTDRTAQVTNLIQHYRLPW